MEKRKTDLVVTGYIFNKNKELLLIHHKKLNMWLPVGGHIEPNETPDEALLREIKEETGLHVRILSESDIPLAGNAKQNLSIPFHVNVHSVGDHDHCSLFYICETLTDKLSVNLDELNDFRWISKGSLSDSSIPEDVRNTALKAFQIKDKNV